MNGHQYQALIPVDIFHNPQYNGIMMIRTKVIYIAIALSSAVNGTVIAAMMLA